MRFRIDRATLRADLIAALTAGIPSIPDAMASGVLAGVSPLFGLYGLIVGTPIAALFTGSTFMSVVTTSAMAIAVGSALTGYEQTDIVPALVTLALVIGVVQLVAGLLRLGFLMRFVSNSVMVGFLTGIAALIVLGQLSDLTGYKSAFSNKVLQAADTLLHLGQIDFPTAIVGVVTLALIVILSRTRVAGFAMLFALVGGAVLARVAGWDSVALVGDTTDIPNALPLPVVPQLLLKPDLLVSGIAVAIIGLVQGAGISASYPNPDGKYPDVSRDFVGQGAGNIAVSLFQGLPVGGSMSSTALLVSAGAKSRLANVLTGLVAAVAVLIFGNAIERLPMAALAAMLIVAGVQSFNRERVQTVWNTSMVSRAMMVFTFAATLILPVQQAVFLGVALHVVFFVFRTAEKLDIMELVPRGDGLFEERAVPRTLPGHQVTVLLPQGSLFFAGAAEFEEELPSTDEADGAVVIVSLRGRREIGSTFIRVVQRYNQSLKQRGGKLMLVGVSEAVQRQLVDTELIDDLGAENVYPATKIVGEALQQALRDAREWLASASK